MRGGGDGRDGSSGSVMVGVQSVPKVVIPPHCSRVIRNLLYLKVKV